MKRILVPTDFSKNAEKALNYAVQLAKKNDGEIFLIHSIESKLTDEEAAKVPDKLNDRSTSIYESVRIKVNPIVYHGIPLVAIEDAVGKFKIDLVVMGTLGNAAFSQKVFGSKTASFIGRSTVPVLAIPLLSEWQVPKKILLAINRFDEDEKLILPVIELAQLFSASIQVSIFTDTDDDYVEDYTEHEVKIARFRDALKKKHKDIEIHAVHLAGHHFKENVKNWIATNNIDIMVMLTHKKNFLEAIFTRSMTKKMSYYIDIPLLAIPV